MNIAKPDCYYIKTKKYTKLYIIHKTIKIVMKLSHYNFLIFKFLESRTSTSLTTSSIDFPKAPAFP